MKDTINSGYIDPINTLKHHLVLNNVLLDSPQPYGMISSDHLDNCSFLHICQLSLPNSSWGLPFSSAKKKQEEEILIANGHALLMSCKNYGETTRFKYSQSL